MAYLTLSDGTVYEGTSFGYNSDVVGEVVFNTGMTGYQELLTDPSYLGQIVNMTYPLIGNYGVNRDDVESDSPKVKGFIVRDYCEAPSNWKSEGTLADYLIDNNIVAIYGIDTRALTRKIRDNGTMVGVLSQELPTANQMLELQSYSIINPVQAVTTKEQYTIDNLDSIYKVAIIDYGFKRNILKSLLSLGMTVTVYPSNTSAEVILADNPNGIMLTNGPGNPKDNMLEIDVIRNLIGKLPIFGICLGHQLLALAYGGDTTKLRYGHRGSNHPVKDLSSDRVFITSQNHGYTVIPESIVGFGHITHLNWNDKTVEGIEYEDGLTFSVQFHPEACPGPKDTSYLFDKFKSLIIATKEKLPCQEI